jgi:hypothetical protein
LLKAYEGDLITEETALLHCVNKPAMRQRLDVAHSLVRRAAKANPEAPMMVVPAADAPVVRMAAEPVVKLVPHAGMLSGMLNSVM